MTPTASTLCPTWCDPRYCETVADGTVRHGSAPVTWRPDSDAELSVRRVWLDEETSAVGFEMTVRDLYGDEIKEATVVLAESDATRLCAAFARLRELTAE